MPGYRGTRSLGTEEFDPFWDACVKAGIPVSMHASDSGYSEYLNDWEPGDEFKPFAPTVVPHGRDGQAAHRGHHGGVGLPRRADPQPGSAHPVDRERRGLGALPVQAVQERLLEDAAGFLEDPIEAFKRCVYVAPFWEDDFAQMAELCGVDRVIFGSDWPHPEGLARADPPDRRPLRVSTRRVSERSWAAT